MVIFHCYVSLPEGTQLYMGMIIHELGSPEVEAISCESRLRDGNHCSTGGSIPGIYFCFGKWQVVYPLVK